MPRSRASRKHIEVRKPSVALLIATDTWDMVPPESRDVPKLLTTSREPGESHGGKPCGREAVEGYAADLCEVSLREYEAPLSHGCVLIVLVSEGRRPGMCANCMQQFVPELVFGLSIGFRSFGVGRREVSELG